jgi:hypothetical protein
MTPDPMPEPEWAGGRAVRLRGDGGGGGGAAGGGGGVRQRGGGAATEANHTKAARRGILGQPTIDRPFPKQSSSPASSHREVRKSSRRPATGASQLTPMITAPIARAIRAFHAAPSAPSTSPLRSLP